MHIPIMKDEIIKLLNVRKDGVYIDCTFGQGGHTRGILERGGVVVALDRDASTEKYAHEIKSLFGDSFLWVHSSFAEILKVWKLYISPMKVDGILFDLGFSSNQIEDQNRGFSFMYDSDLDMRYDISEETLTALELINSVSEKSLAEIFWNFGEERLAARISHEIYEYRKKKRIESCFELLDVIKHLRRFGDRHFATKIFQALRIVVNNEFDHIKLGVVDAMKLLRVYGKIAVLSFHSLEDRLIKNFFCNKNLLMPSSNEVCHNPRSRSAKLRWWIKPDMESVC